MGGLWGRYGRFEMFIYERVTEKAYPCNMKLEKKQRRKNKESKTPTFTRTSFLHTYAILRKSALVSKCLKKLIHLFYEFILFAFGLCHT